ncbi:MAG: hydantoinase B/oxoprolinase family protein, partial [Gammaproteobacteria bacterium]
RTHRVQLQLRKKGSKIVFTNDGSAAQEGAMNATYSGWRGAIMVAVTELLCWDQYFAVGGALRHIDFDPTPGTLNCADFPASVSTAPIQSMEISLYPAYNVLSKMIYPDAEMRRDIMCIGGTSQWPATLFRGIDQWGERYGYLLIDPIGGAIGAFAHGDGINTGGQSRTPICQLPNIEHTEQNFPILFLYRKELADSGGAGRYRGGLSAESCFIPHNTESVTQDTLSSGNATPTSTGMMGGYPSTTNAYTFIRDSDILERIEASRLIEDITEVRGTPETLGLRQENFVQHPTDVYAVRWTGGGGFGDPLDRAPEDIERDLEDFAITAFAAHTLYGAVVTPDGKIDGDATAAHREELRTARVRRNSRPARERSGTWLFDAGACLHVKQDANGSFWACAKCATELGATSLNYKEACIREDLPVTKANPLIGDPARFIDEVVSFRQFCCPGCGAQIDNEIAVERDPVLCDISVAAP